MTLLTEFVIPESHNNLPSPHIFSDRPEASASPKKAMGHCRNFFYYGKYWNGKTYPFAMGKLLPFGYPTDQSQEINFARGYANGITKYMANGKKISHLQMDMVCQIKFCQNRRNHFCPHFQRNSHSFHLISMYCTYVHRWIMLFECSWTRLQLWYF